MADIQIDGDIEELCAQINSGEAAEGYARLQMRNLQHLREWEDAVGRVSFLFQSPLASGAMPPDMPEPEPSETFLDQLRAMLRLTYDRP